MRAAAKKKGLIRWEEEIREGIINGAKALWSGRFVWRRLQKCMIMESEVREEGGEDGGRGGKTLCRNK